MNKEHIGITHAVPGSGGGFTMAVFAGVVAPVGTKLYAAPVAQPLTPLTDEQIDNICADTEWSTIVAHREFARAILAAAGAKL
jgi:hypothetical protein